jgi:fructose-1,6-bisphosphatase II
MGRGMKNEADDAATTAMRGMFDSISMKGTVVIGEGEMDEAPMLYIGEQLGNGDGPEVDVAVDPIEGTALVAKGLDHALSVLAIAPKGKLLHAPDMYMEKLSCGPQLKGHLRLDDPLEETLRKSSQILNKPIADITVCILERERHARHIDTLRRTGCRIKLISDGDVAGAMAAAFPQTGVDLYVGSGGAPEGVLAAAALSCLGGELQGRLLPATPEEEARCRAMGLEEPRKLLSMVEMVGDDDVIFAATGITPGDFLDGVLRLPDQYAETHSLVMRAKTRTIRYIKATHYLPNKPLL